MYPNITIVRNKCYQVPYKNLLQFKITRQISTPIFTTAGVSIVTADRCDASIYTSTSTRLLFPKQLFRCEWPSCFRRKSTTRKICPGGGGSSCESCALLYGSRSCARPRVIRSWRTQLASNSGYAAEVASRQAWHWATCNTPDTRLRNNASVVYCIDIYYYKGGFAATG